jgi:hypothetical protein
MSITETRIPAVKLIEPKVFGDERGFFTETWNQKAFREAGINATFVQDNHSRSVKTHGQAHTNVTNLDDLLLSGKDQDAQSLEQATAELTEYFAAKTEPDA